MKNSIKSFVLLTIVFGLVSVDVYALGDREKGALAGIVGTLIITDMIKDREFEHQYPIRINRNDRFYCNKDEITCAYERGRWERERREYEEAKRRAYECGYTGLCE